MPIDAFWRAFIPLFVALDGVGLVPVFVALTERLSRAERMRAVGEASLTALLASIGFLAVSASVFALMGLALADIMIAGGLILLVICLRELVLPGEAPRGRYASPGVVPLGVPLLAGPAVLTTVLLVRDQAGWAVTLAALAANLALVWGLLAGAERLMRWLGREGSQLISKIFNLVLTAYGVMLIRRGVLILAAGG